MYSFYSYPDVLARAGVPACRWRAAGSHGASGAAENPVFVTNLGHTMGVLPGFTTTPAKRGDGTVRQSW